MARYRRYGRSKWHRKKGKIGRVIFSLLLICVATYLLLALDDELGKQDLQLVQASGDGDFSVHFIDVGQGDSSLILSDGSAILIDAGENDQGKTVCDYLTRLGIKRIDLLIMTHPHSDHIGGMDTVIGQFEIRKIVMPRLPDELVPTTKTYTDVLLAVAEKGLKITPAKAGDRYAFGSGELTVLGPMQDYDDLNNMSLVCSFNYADKRFLFTGDMEAPVETDMIAAGNDLRADVLKVGHHGSKTSTSPAFYREVDPQICVISVGAGNSYGHPSLETLETIAANGAQVCRTDYQGSIVICIENGSLTVNVGKERKVTS